MDSDVTETELIARLKRLESSACATPTFDYDLMVERHSARQARARRRHVIARGTASVLVVALVAASVWRLDRPAPEKPVAMAVAVAEAAAPRPRIVRADTYFAVAALEDHLASVDDALTDARMRGGTAQVASLERTRAELLDSYAQVRYAAMVSANF